MNRVKVVVRLRPLFVRGESEENANVIQYDVANKLLWVMPRDAEDKKNRRQFKFDGLVGPESTQYDAYAAVLPAIESVFDGVNGCVMCYGQTGSGKTHTLSNMSKDPDQVGVMPRAFNRIFEYIDADAGTHQWKLTVQYVQIYTEILMDLLQPSNEPALREDNGMVVLTGAEEVPVSSADECYKVMQRGLANRATSKTLMNAQSSRSHAMYILNVERSGGPEMTLNKSSLFLVDLAGSERIKKSGVENAGRDEAISINKSLTALGRCITAMADRRGKTAPPFRESKLTRLLQTALSGGGRTSLIVCCAMGDSDVQETNSSLEFAQQAMRVQVKEVRREQMDYGAFTAHLQAQVDTNADKANAMYAQVVAKLKGDIEGAMEKSAEAAGLKSQIANLKLLNEELGRQAEALKGKGGPVKASSGPKVAEAQNKLKQMTQQLQEAQKERDEVTVMLPDIAAEYRELGGHAWHNGDTAKAQAFYEKALHAHIKCMGKEHPEVACSMGDLANVFCDQGRFDEALGLYQQAYKVHKDAFGADHVDTAGDLASMGLVYSVQGKHKDAYPLLKEAHKIMATALDPDHPNVQQVKVFLDKTKAALT